MSKVTVRVPATTANLGPGFDSVGCAFSLYNVISFEPAETLVFEGCEEQYKNEENLALVGFDAVLAATNNKRGGLKITFHEINIPVSRGLGSSSSLLVAGALAADYLYDCNLTKGELLCICNRLEGHPDNLSPAIYGGLTASMVSHGTPYSVSYNIHRNLHFVALIPDFTLLTSVARAVLPKTVPFADAVFNESRVAILLKALETGDGHLISLSLRDTLHQPYRKHLIKDYDMVKYCAKQCGALAFCISGAGSTCLCLASDDMNFSDNLKDLLKEKGITNWDVIPLTVDYEGAKII